MTGEHITEKNPEIRTTTLEDIESVRRLQAAVWRTTYPNDAFGVSEHWVFEETKTWFTPEALHQSEEFLKPILESPDHFHQVAFEHGRLIGFIHGSRIQNNQRLEGLYIEPDYHGTGLAQLLTDNVFAWYDLSKDVRLEVAEYNNRAKAFYSKYNFQQ